MQPDSLISSVKLEASKVEKTTFDPPYFQAIKRMIAIDKVGFAMIGHH